MRSLTRSSLLLGTLVIAACGGDGDGGGKAAKGGQSFDAITSAVQAPTGTVDETTAPDVAAEFEKIGQSSAAKQKQAGSQDVACPNGGSIRTSAEGSGNNVRSELVYDNCCSEGCCSDGSALTYVSGSETAEYAYCATYDLTYSCAEEDENTRVVYEGCAGNDGSWIYAVRVGGKSYAVTGSYSNGNGTLEVTGENGHFSCTYTEYSGSCTGDAGSFDF